MYVHGKVMFGLWHFPFSVYLFGAHLQAHSQPVDLEGDKRSEDPGDEEELLSRQYK